MFYFNPSIVNCVASRVLFPRLQAERSSCDSRNLQSNASFDSALVWQPPIFFVIKINDRLI